MIKWAAVTNQHNAEKKGIGVFSPPSRNMVPVLDTKSPLGQIPLAQVYNLFVGILNHALDHYDPKKVVKTIRVDGPYDIGDEYELTILDTGRGLNPTNGSTEELGSEEPWKIAQRAMGELEKRGWRLIVRDEPGKQTKYSVRIPKDQMEFLQVERR